MKASGGYTFMELLVVITIMSFLGIGILLRQNFSKEDNALKNAAANLQSLIRVAQSNAQSSALCEGNGSSSWEISSINNNKKMVELKCDDQINPPTAITQETLNFADTIEIDSITGNGGCPTVFPTQILTIRFKTLSGKPNFESPIANFCVTSSSYVDIKLKNTKTTNTLTVTVDKGGSIDVK